MTDAERSRLVAEFAQKVRALIDEIPTEPFHCADLVRNVFPTAPELP